MFVMDMEVGNSNNVVFLSDLFGSNAGGAGHRCRHTCNIQHIWANLYRCNTSNSTHVCDKNCDQKIVYDNHSSICIVSRQVRPLSGNDLDCLKGMRRKRDGEASEGCGFKRRSVFSPTKFMQIAVASSGAGDCAAMDMN